MIQPPTIEDLKENIDECLVDLRLLIARMQKEKVNSTTIGCVKDHLSSLELVQKFGSYGGKVPSPVSEPALSIFKKHGLEGLIHKPWVRKFRN